LTLTLRSSLWAIIGSRLRRFRSWQLLDAYGNAATEDVKMGLI
jgi:hypothetical protein